MSSRWLWVLIVAGAAVSCYDKPVYNYVPSISIENFYFKQIANSPLDSMVIVLNFQDGDGDLGLDASQTDPPYHLYTYYVIQGDTLELGENDTLPPFNCIDYEIVAKFNDAGMVINADTIYVQRNPNYFNYFLTFMVRDRASGNYRAFDPAVDRNCAPPYNGRFFNLNTTGDVRPLEGELRFGLSSGFRLLFRNDSLKIRVQIQDRALNKSEIRETEPFMINDIILPPS
jgi:hypothetical protein